MTNRYWVGASGLGLGVAASIAACSFPSLEPAVDGFAGMGGDASAGVAGEIANGGMLVSGGDGGTGGGAVLPPGAAIGEACNAKDSPCRAGLACSPKSLCIATHDSALGSACVISDECVDGAQCFAGKCAKAGEGVAGVGCTTDLDCSSGFRCALAGLSLSCIAQGEVDIGGKCETLSACAAGLGCVDGACAVTPPGSVFGKPWKGVVCAEPDGKAKVRAYFEVPGAKDAQTGDFFRLPFPNDALRSAKGVLDLKGFPTPGPALLGFDPVQLYVDAISANDSAWGAYPTVTFRFSGAVDGATLDQSAIHISDITPDLKPGQDDSGNWTSTYSGGRSNYVCENWFAMERGSGKPLQPGHSYAFWLSSSVQAAAGGKVERSENLSSLLADTPPTDAKLKAAYAAYKPFRDYIGSAASGAPKTADDVLNVSVITVGAIRAPMQAIAEAVAKEPIPSTHDWVKCAKGVTSPCPQAEGDRACGAANAAYDEYQALVSLPIFQKGFPEGEPYVTPEDGGDIEIKSPAPREDVCLGLTIPKGVTMPASGWPVVIFSHGTGGSFRSHMSSTTAGVLSKSATPFAVLGIDQVEHGPRRGKSQESPNNLFFNFGNPKAARGNPLQGAADQLSLVRLVSAFDLTAEQSGGDAIKLDPASVTFFGHSQGSTEGSLAMPYADGIKAVVLSGNGAALKFSLINKTSPVNVAQALPFVLQDPSLAVPGAVPEMHPVLSILQQWIDPADPLNFARVITRAPETGHTAKNVFQTYGLGDTFAPPATLREYVIAGLLDVVAADSSAPKPDQILGLKAAPSGVFGNVTVANVKYTLGVRQYGPAKGDDGHFVAFSVPSANADVVRFLSSAVSSADAPPIGDAPAK